MIKRILKSTTIPQIC